MAKINWAAFNNIQNGFSKSLCVGEEKTLTTEEIDYLNEMLTDIAGKTDIMVEAFQEAQIRFKRSRK